MGEWDVANGKYLFEAKHSLGASDLRELPLTQIDKYLDPSIKSFCNFGRKEVVVAVKEIKGDVAKFHEVAEELIKKYNDVEKSPIRLKITVGLDEVDALF